MSSIYYQRHVIAFIKHPTSPSLSVKVTIRESNINRAAVYTSTAHFSSDGTFGTVFLWLESAHVCPGNVKIIKSIHQSLKTSSSESLGESPGRGSDTTLCSVRGSWSPLQLVAPLVSPQRSGSRH